MKKLACLMVALMVCLVGFMTFRGVKLAYAEEVEIEETDETGLTIEEVETEEVEEITEETEPKLTEEELIGLIESVLSEQQKNFAQNTANLIAEKFGLNVTTVYIIVACIVGAIVVAFVLIGKIITGKATNAKLNEKVKAIQACYQDKEQFANSIAEFVKNLDKEHILEVVKEALNGVKDEFKGEVVQSIIQGLKIDGNTLASLLGVQEVNSQQIGKVVEALKCLAKDAGREDMCAVLATAPTVELVNKLALENEKLKTALGDEKVKEVLQ